MESYTIDGVIKVILALIVLVNGFFAYRLVVDLIRHKSEVRREPGSHLLFAFLGSFPSSWAPSGFPTSLGGAGLALQEVRSGKPPAWLG